MQNLSLYKLKEDLQYLKTFDIIDNKIHKVTYWLYLDDTLILQLSPVIHDIDYDIMDAYGNMITEKVSALKVLVRNSIFNVFLKDLYVV